jgi:hypothetical protein
MGQLDTTSHGQTNLGTEAFDAALKEETEANKEDEKEEEG